MSAAAQCGSPGMLMAMTTSASKRPPRSPARWAVLDALSRRAGMLEDVDIEPGLPVDRRQEIDARLDAVRVRLKTLRERGSDVGNSGAATSGERLAAAQRYAAEAHAAAMEVLAASTEAFRNAAKAHERTASMHERAAAAGIGDVRGHERQAAVHWAGAAADRQRAERARQALSGLDRPGPAAVSC